MITVRMIQYWNDYHKKELREQFRDLKELEDWIFGQMRVDYSSEHGRNLLSFPKCDTERWIYQISVRPEYGGYVYWIKLIEDRDMGIVFSDGTFTAGQKHCTRAVREWLAGCEARKRNPTFHFAEDEAGAKGDSDSYGQDGEKCTGLCAMNHCKNSENVDSKDSCISGLVVKRAIGRIHGAGGCDAADEYAKGYDDGIAVALDILLKETGYCLDDVLEMDEHYSLKQ